MANGPLYKPVGLPCSTVGQAMTRLGLRETAQLLSRFLVQNAIPVNNRQLARFWERSGQNARRRWTSSPSNCRHVARPGAASNLPACRHAVLLQA